MRVCVRVRVRVLCCSLVWCGVVGEWERTKEYAVVRNGRRKLITLEGAVEKWK